jgi:hypothetical protein
LQNFPYDLGNATTALIDYNDLMDIIQRETIISPNLVQSFCITFDPFHRPYTKEDKDILTHLGLLEDDLQDPFCITQKLLALLEKYSSLSSV